MKKQNSIWLIAGMAAVTLAAAFLVGALFWWNANKESVYAARLERQLAAGRYEAAAATAELLSDTDAVQRVSLAHARALYEAGDYAGAEELLASLGTYEDAADVLNACRYQEAAALENAGEYDKAAEAFSALSGYSDSLTRSSACRYQLAEAALASGDEQDAFERFLSLGTYEDAADRAGEIACNITGLTDPKRAIALAQGYSEDDWERLQLLEEARSSLGPRTIACGWQHAVLLGDDGKVTVRGDNTYGQCDTSSWSGITEVAAGAFFTLGLKGDGTVLSCGDNTYGQCDTASWTDVTAIYAGDYDAFGLKANGTVLHTGYTALPTDTWSNILCFAAGNCCASAVSGDGTVLCSFSSGVMEAQSSACGMAVNLGWTAVLHTDGTVASDTVSVSDWTDVVSLNCSSTVLCGLRSDGTLCAIPLMRGGEKLAAALNGQQQVQEVSLAGSWGVIRHTDGSTEVVGETELTID